MGNKDPEEECRRPGKRGTPQKKEAQLSMVNIAQHIIPVITLYCLRFFPRGLCSKSLIFVFQVFVFHILRSFVGI